MALTKEQVLEQLRQLTNPSPEEIKSKIPANFLSDKDVMIAAVNKNWKFLGILDDQYKTEDVVIAAVRQNANALISAFNSLTPKIIMEAVQQNAKDALTLVWDYMDDNVLIPDETILAAVQKDGMALESVPAERQTKEIVNAALAQNKKAIKFKRLPAPPGPPGPPAPPRPPPRPTQSEEFTNRYIKFIDEKVADGTLTELEGTFMKENHVIPDMVQKGEITLQQSVTMMTNPILCYSQLFDELSSLPDADIVQFLRTRGIPGDDDALLERYRTYPNVTVVLDEYYNSEGKEEMDGMISTVLGALEKEGIYETENEVKMFLFGNKNAEAAIQHYRELKEQYDTAIGHLPALKQQFPTHSVDILFNVLGDASGDLPKSIVQLTPGNGEHKVSDLSTLSVPKWRYIMASKEDKETMDWMICLSTYDILQDTVKKLNDSKTRYTQEQDKYPSYFNRCIHLESFHESEILDQLKRLRRYAVACNKACTLDLSEGLMKLLVPFFLFEKLVSKAAKYDDEGQMDFLNVMTGEILTTLKYIHPLKNKKFSTFFDFMRFLHPDNLIGYSSIDSRMYVPMSNHRQTYNWITPNVAEKQLLVTRGGTRKHKVYKKKTVRLT